MLRDYCSANDAATGGRIQARVSVFVKLSVPPSLMIAVRIAFESWGSDETTPAPMGLGLS